VSLGAVESGAVSPLSLVGTAGAAVAVEESGLAPAAESVDAVGSGAGVALAPVDDAVESGLGAVDTGVAVAVAVEALPDVPLAVVGSPLPDEMVDVVGSAPPEESVELVGSAPPEDNVGVDGTVPPDERVVGADGPSSESPSDPDVVVGLPPALVGAVG
jgi:hypothetical protein